MARALEQGADFNGASAAVAEPEVISKNLVIGIPKEVSEGRIGPRHHPFAIYHDHRATRRVRDFGQLAEIARGIHCQNWPFAFGP